MISVKPKHAESQDSQQQDIAFYKIRKVSMPFCYYANILSLQISVWILHLLLLLKVIFRNSIFYLFISQPDSHL